MSFRVFVSSRMNSELSEFREAAYHTIRGAGCYPVLYEEEAGSPEHAEEWWRRRIEGCDLFLLVVCETVSPAVFDEVQTARRMRKPIIVAVVDQTVYDTRSYVPTDPSDALPSLSEKDLADFARWVSAPKSFIASNPQDFQRELNNALWALPEVASGLPGELRKIESVFVPPVQYQEARVKLSETRLVLITGPPHIGKTASALRLAAETKDKMGLRAIVRLRPSDGLEPSQWSPEVVFVLDDWFGESALSARSHAEQFGELVRLSERSPVIVTTRSQVLSEAMRSTRLGESHMPEQHQVELSQEGSYDSNALRDVLTRHLAFMQSDLADPRYRVTPEQAELARRHQHEVVRQLRFPHNIERLCAVHLKSVQTEAELDAAIQMAKEITLQTRQWAEQLDPRDRWFVFLVALFPGIPARTLHRIYRTAGDAFRFTLDTIAHLADMHRAYIGPPPHVFGHPSYREAVVALLRERYRQEVGEIVDAGLEAVLRDDLLSFARSEQADYGWPRPAQAGGVPITTYLEGFIEAYNTLRSQTFSQLLPMIPPCTPGPAAALFIVDSDSTGGTLLVVPGQEGQPSVYVEEPSHPGQRVGQLMDQFAEGGRPLAARRFPAWDLGQRSPQTHAFVTIRDEVAKLFKKQRLREAWPIVYGRLEASLRYLNHPWFGMSIDWRKPFGESELKEVQDTFASIAQQDPPQGWHPKGWQSTVASHARHAMAAYRGVELLQQYGRKYTGPLLPQPDQEVGGWIWDGYSAQQMKRTLQRSLELALESYEWMAEHNFPQLTQNMHLYRSLPVKVLGTAAYGSDFASSWGWFYLLPHDFPTQDGANIELYVVSEREGGVNPLPSLDDEVEARQQQSGVGEPVHQFRTDIGAFLSVGELIGMVYSWLKRDLDNALGWSHSGSGRQRAFAQAATPNSAWDIARFVDPLDVLDWPGA